MDIKIGFTDNPRELAISTDGDQDSTVNEVRDALAAGSKVIELADNRGRRYLLRAETIAYVELGASTARPVGFVQG
ncbi:DUF3107 domain-containing protein [Corynebacterium sp. 13CS0277]|uniref:DUF3107 domain-containing protein n=1 Tax=Corynebacterium sp. 13CS0277 TaxID=2071994 RepID=UPI000D03C24F|nr:DUF3107 domain-containing protein [Corynebacterium sp. 13CS0277]PRQ11462.1 DUF3107 domain-containing protein [Corynebacterium sp. 13CS0277]